MQSNHKATRTPKNPSNEVRIEEMSLQFTNSLLSPLAADVSRFVITSFLFGLCIWWFVCQQDYEKTTGPIFMKLSQSM